MIQNPIGIGKLNPIILFVAASFSSVFVSQALATCPVVLSSNSSFPLDDMGEANCSITINSGITLSPVGSVGVTASGNGGTIINNGTLSTVGGQGIWVRSGGLATITNNGVINTDTSQSLWINTGGSAAFYNTGTISTTGPSTAIDNRGTLSTFNNSGQISNSATGGSTIINTSTINNFTNTGTITSGSSNLIAIDNQSGATISNLTNNGSIVGGASSWGIQSSGSISTFNNGQGGNGAGSSTTALTYKGNLPTNYSTIVSSPTRYGQLNVSAPVGATTFGIYAGGVSGVAASNLAAGTYSSVLTGLSPSNIAGSTSGTYGSYNWLLSNVSGTRWDLVVTAGSGGGSSSTESTSSSSSSIQITTVQRGQTVSFNNLGSSLTLNGGMLSLNQIGSWVTAPISLSAGGSVSVLDGNSTCLCSNITGGGGLNIVNSANLNGVVSTINYSWAFSGLASTVRLSGVNTFSGGLYIGPGVVVIFDGYASLGSGAVYVSPGAVLMGSGSLSREISVGGIFKPGNSPGYVSSQSTITMQSGSTYREDIAGVTQSNALSPIGATGYYSFTNILNGQFVINTGATLAPMLTNLFSSDESGYGSAPYVPRLGDQFRILTATEGVSGRFSSLVQPDGLDSGTQFVSFYNMNNNNSLDLAVIPSSYKSTISSASGNKNAQSVGSVLDQITLANTSGTSTFIQDQLLYSISNLTSGSDIASYAQSLAGEVYAAAVAVIAQTTQRVQQAVLTRLGDTAGLGLPDVMTNPAGNSALMNTTNTALNGGVASSAVSTNPSINPNAEAQAFSNKNVWGELAYQKGNRSSDSYSGGWNSNLYQLVFGSDWFKSNGMTMGGGFALSSTTLNPTYGSGMIQQGSLFAYGKIPVKGYVVDAMASFGLNSSNLSRGDITNLSGGFSNKNIKGNDALVSLGLSRLIDLDTNLRVTPFARVTWQMVTQSSVNEGDVASALSINRFTGNGVRGVIGAAVGSKTNNPMTEKYTYRAYLGVGADSSGLLNPTMNASLAGLSTNITTPNADAAFVQAGLYGTAKIADNTFAYAGIAGEARGGQTLGVVSAGVRIQF